MNTGNYGVCGRRTDLDRPFLTCIFFLLLSCPGSRHQTGLSGHRLQRAHNGDVFISSWPLAQGQGLEPVRAWIGTPLIELGLIVLTNATRDSRPILPRGGGDSCLCLSRVAKENKVGVAAALLLQRRSELKLVPWWLVDSSPTRTSEKQRP